MSEPEIPPIIGATQIQPNRPKWRWAIHVALLAGYVLALGLAGAFFRPEAEKAAAGPAMPDNVRSLAILCMVEMGTFMALFATAWMFSRARPEELFLKWRGGIRPILWGIAYSVLLRLAIMVVVMVIAVPIFLTKGKDAVENLRPKTEAIVNTTALKDPLYLVVALTVVSFGVAGFREELWRAGMLAGLAALAPALFSSRRGQYLAVAIAALIFGLGHLPQGAGGVVLIGALGFGLGCIIVRHQSVWEAVIAHGFFDATTFAALYVVIRYFPEALRGLGASA